MYANFVSTPFLTLPRWRQEASGGTTTRRGSPKCPLLERHGTTREHLDGHPEAPVGAVGGGG